MGATGALAILLDLAGLSGPPLGLVAPGWAVLLLYLVWGGLLAAALPARTERPWLVPAAPVVAFGVAAATLAVGGSLLGWTP